jgi:hypothetical protein
MLSSKNLPKGKAGGYLALGITCIVWGTTWVASKIGVAEIPVCALFVFLCCIKNYRFLHAKNLYGC